MGDKLGPTRKLLQLADWILSSQEFTTKGLKWKIKVGNIGGFYKGFFLPFFKFSIVKKNIYKQVILIILARTCFSFFFFFFYWNFRLPASSFWIHQFGLDFHIQKAQKRTRVGTEKQLKKPMNFCERWKTFNFFWVHLYLSMETIFYHNVGFLFLFLQWLMDHPQFLPNPLYIGGDSYSGKTVPIIAHEISNGNPH